MHDLHTRAHCDAHCRSWSNWDVSAELSPDAKIQIRRQFGAGLRKLRREKQLTGTALADIAGIGRSTISRIEHGRIAPSPEVAMQLLAAMDVGSGIERELMALARALDPHDLGTAVTGDVEISQQQTADMERVSSEIGVLTMNCIPALLQTPEYATKVIEQLAHVGLLARGADPIEAGMIRARRQAELLDENKRFVFIVAEAALLKPFLHPVDMRMQLDVMMARVRAENIEFRVLPTVAMVHGAALTSFMILDNRAVIYELPNGVNHVSTPSSVARYQACFADVLSQALSISRSMSLLRTLRDSFGEGRPMNEAYEFTDIDLRNSSDESIAVSSSSQGPP